MRILREGPPAKIHWWEDARVTCGDRRCRSLFELEASDGTAGRVWEIQASGGNDQLAVTCPVCKVVTYHDADTLRKKHAHRMKRLDRPRRGLGTTPWGG